MTAGAGRSALGLWTGAAGQKCAVLGALLGLSLLLASPYSWRVPLAHGGALFRQGSLETGPQSLPNVLSPHQLAASVLSPLQPCPANRTDPEFLQRLWEYKPFLPPPALRRGLAYYGGAARLRRVADKMLRGEEVSMVTLGGSVTYGSGALYGGTYPARLQAWLDQVFPGPGAGAGAGAGQPGDSNASANASTASSSSRVKVVNSGLPATPSSLFSVCVDRFVPKEADLVVVEFAINDTPFPAEGQKDPMATVPDRLAFEQLLRKLLQFPGRPAVVLLMHWSWFYWSTPPQGNVFYCTAENDMTVFAQFYDLPVLSLRAAAYPLFVQNLPGFQVHLYRQGNENITKEEDLFYYDQAHPQDRTGYRALSDLLVSLFRVAISDVLARPLDDDDRTSLEASLPEPMIQGNYESPASVCVTQKELEGMATAKDRFSFVAEKPEEASVAKQKWGWRGEEPGAWVEFRVNTANTAQLEKAGGEGEGRKSELLLSYLRSWRSEMGVARVECVRHCRCKPRAFDGRWEERSTQAQLHRMKVSAHPECLVRVTVEGNSSESGGGDGGRTGHKVHLMGIMVETVGGTQKALPVDVFV